MAVYNEQATKASTWHNLQEVKTLEELQLLVMNEIDQSHDRQQTQV